MIKIFKNNKVFILSSIILSLLITISVDFVENKHFSILNSGFWIKFLVFTFLFLGIFLIINCLDNKLLKKINIKNNEYTEKELTYYFILNSIFLFCILIFAYLALYPGYFTYDAPSQILQVFYYNKLDAHQPVIHTLLLCGCISLGINWLGSTNLGLAIYTLIQMMIVILSFSYMFVKLLSFKGNKWIVIISELIIVLNPVFQIFVMTSTKDVIFSALFIVWIINVLEMYENKESFFTSIRKNIFYIINTILMCLFRKQGIYIVFFIGLIQCFKFKEYKKRFISLFVIILVMYNLIIGPISTSLGISISPVKEMLSVPLQQIARVINEDGNINDKQKSIFFKYVSEENTKKYIPYISDPIKDSLNEVYFNNHIKDFFKLYIDIGINNLSTYIDSFLYGIVGYFSPIEDVENDYIGIFEFFNSKVYRSFAMPYIKEGAVLEDSKFIEYKVYLEEVRSTLLSNVPIVSFWCNTSFSFWITAISTVIIINKKNKKYIIVPVILILFYSILALGPVCCIRYILPVMFVVPIMISLAFKNNEIKNYK